MTATASRTGFFDINMTGNLSGLHLKTLVNTFNRDSGALKQTIFSEIKLYTLLPSNNLPVAVTYKSHFQGQRG